MKTYTAEVTFRLDPVMGIETPEQFIDVLEECIRDGALDGFAKVVKLIETNDPESIEKNDER